MALPFTVPSRTTHDGMRSGFQMLAMIAALALAWTVGDSWKNHEKEQGERLFKIALCDLPKFRTFVEYSLSQNGGYSFLFQESQGSWFDSRGIFMGGGRECDDKEWMAAEDQMLTGFDIKTAFIWMNMHGLEDNVKDVIAKFQKPERLYSWSTALFLASLVISILGSTVFSMAPANKMALMMQMPAMILAIGLVFAGMALFTEAHKAALYGEAAFRGKSFTDSRLLPGVILALPLTVICLCMCCGSAAMAHKGGSLYEEERDAPMGHGDSKGEQVERDV